jgi:hypothetical protein
VHHNLPEDDHIEAEWSVILLVEELILTQLNQVKSLQEESHSLRGYLAQEIVKFHEVYN